MGIRTGLAILAPVFVAVALVFSAATARAQELPDDMSPRWSIAIHGGAGTMAPDVMTAEQQADYKRSLQNALDAGSAVLRNGGSALDAVEVTIRIMEDDARFNAGRGAVFTWDGTNELDASIMDGRDRSAGAATGITRTRHPISLARRVMENSRHVFLSGEGAEQFARDQGLEAVDPSHFATQPRRDALDRMKARQLSAAEVDLKFGTVGAVALDLDGNLAAGTSTGGMTGKRWGRIGDSPIIGAGTYADNAACAVSATGSGEYFIRLAVAHEICSSLRRERLSEHVPCPDDTESGYSSCWTMPVVDETVTQEVVDAVIADLGSIGGDGGVIVTTPEGHTIFSFNTPGMYRGRANSAGMSEVAIFAAE